MGRPGLKALTIHRHLLGRRGDDGDPPAAPSQDENEDDDDDDDDEDKDDDADDDGKEPPARRSSRWAFAHDEANPLAADAVIVDEASMLDTWLFNALLRALPPGCRLVLIGDADQLPSIGAGQILADVLSCGVVASVRLTKVYRQQRSDDDAGTSIIDQAYSILSGKPNRHAFLRPLLSEHASLLDDSDEGEGDGADGDDGFGGDDGWGDVGGAAPAAAPAASDAAAGGGSRGHCVFFDAGSDPAAVHNLMRTELLDFVRRCGFDPGADMQVVTHGHAGALGTHALNVLFRSLLNPTDADVTADTRGGGDGDGTAAAPATPDDVYAPRRLDRVMQTRNNYDTGAMNGDTGHVEGVHAAPGGGTMAVDVFFPSLVVGGEGRRVLFRTPALRHGIGSPTSDLLVLARTALARGTHAELLRSLDRKARGRRRDDDDGDYGALRGLLGDGAAGDDARALAFAEKHRDILLAAFPTLHENVQLSYATTVHKVQGSEFPLVVMPMAAAHFMLTRKLLYTAVTRARSMLVLVGDRTAFVKSVANNRDKDRHTLLGDFLQFYAQEEQQQHQLAQSSSKDADA